MFWKCCFVQGISTACQFIKSLAESPSECVKGYCKIRFTFLFWNGHSQSKWWCFGCQIYLVIIGNNYSKVGSYRHEEGRGLWFGISCTQSYQGIMYGLYCSYAYRLLERCAFSFTGKKHFCVANFSCLKSLKFYLIHVLLFSNELRFLTENFGTKLSFWQNKQGRFFVVMYQSYICKVMYSLLFTS